ncbi:acyl-CoA dehydrogenase family protein [Mycobacterium sp. CVI_P3]|uniref:Acyl-CoA dehydrogenase family protein n=1 Tax=Mycobacterium pinniadriaticum TaxID=2994102 RepID=A0ABT3SMT9_9MYCO|nr:acyl-CoA dehydrogenase family protein [Mycobacterium pinniadriaticum]MCX2934428.1 acyl-CoA dehydrogenase family protein [Mycobacterium pinniadriaticum]MCX2940851.1 acyl-CoA dehydrogenase family protein [Mycobacterium pinniadriaticum]
MRRQIFDEFHEEFRGLCRSFFERECVPHTEKWEADGQVSREAWLQAGRLGLLAWDVPEEFGGAGTTDFRLNAVQAEEFWATGTVGIGLGIQNDVIPPYLIDLTTSEQKARWLPGVVSGETITAIAISEPGAGSDIRSIATTAHREGDEYVIHGSKTFISNGFMADLVVVACKTRPEDGHRGISLIAVESGRPGFERGRKLDKIGQHARDTAELSFQDVRVPVENLIGEEGEGFYYMMRNLPRERLGIAVHGAAAAQRAYQITLDYARNREAFGTPISNFQVNRHALAEMHTKLQVLQTYLDQCTVALNTGDLTAAEAAGAKWWSTETQWEIIDRCLQMYGGYGYVNEYEIARIWRDSRVQRIYGGTNEIMKDLIGRALGC